MAEIPTADALIKGAERETGLSDWGDPFFFEPFELLVADLNSVAQLNALGAGRAEQRLSNTLRQRLRLVDSFKRNPAIASEVIAEPIFVTGLPRTGTTFFFNILAADPKNRAPLTWEIMLPAARPQHAGEQSASEGAAQAMLDYQGFSTPELQAIHPFSALRPEECNFIWELSFISVNYTAWWHVPNYAKALNKADYAKVYAEERRFLQFLQYGSGPRRWVLKSPIHSVLLPKLFEVFSDAWIVQTHRDPAKSIGSMYQAARIFPGLFSDMERTIDYDILKVQAGALGAMDFFRNQSQIGSRCFDAHYSELRKSPLAVLSSMYEKFGIEWDEERRKAVSAWLDADKAERLQTRTHSYSLEGAGLSSEAVDAVLGGYLKKYRVELERA